MNSNDLIYYKTNQEIKRCGVSLKSLMKKEGHIQEGGYNKSSYEGLAIPSGLAIINNCDDNNSNTYSRVSNESSLINEDIFNILLDKIIK
uniref:Uncharacterized protein n=1 Tax=viral metagenome TaxID=1070528 RepID=A0A6C0KIS6_9ZZZZ